MRCETSVYLDGWKNAGGDFPSGLARDGSRSATDLTHHQTSSDATISATPIHSHDSHCRQPTLAQGRRPSLQALAFQTTFACREHLRHSAVSHVRDRSNRLLRRTHMGAARGAPLGPGPARTTSVLARAGAVVACKAGGGGVRRVAATSLVNCRSNANNTHFQSDAEGR